MLDGDIQFFFVEADDLQFPPEAGADANGTEAIGGQLESSAHAELYETLLKDFSELPRKAKKVDLDNYAVINVSPSVVPNPYLPSFRIYSYNVSNAETATWGEVELKKTRAEKGAKRKHGHHHGGGNREALCKKAGYRDSWRCKLREPWNSDPDSPSRRNTLWTPLGYAQVRGVLDLQTCLRAG